MEKNTEISERVKHVIDFLKLTPNEFAKNLGYKRSQTVYDILSGKSAPSFDFFNKLANSEYSELINFKNLLSGNGDIFKGYDEPVHEKGMAAEHQEPINPPESTGEYKVDFERTIDALHKTISAQEITIEAQQETIETLKELRATKSRKKGADNPSGTVPR